MRGSTVRFICVRKSSLSFFRAREKKSLGLLVAVVWWSSEGTDKKNELRTVASNPPLPAGDGRGHRVAGGPEDQPGDGSGAYAKFPNQNLRLCLL